MCQIVGITTKVKKGEIIPFIAGLGSSTAFIDNVYFNLLSRKGDPTTAQDATVIMLINRSVVTMSWSEFANPDYLEDIIQDIPNNENNDVVFRMLVFNRMAPETEENSASFEQPYFNNSIKKYFAVHGLIKNDAEIKHKYNMLDYNVDTDIFMDKNIETILDNDELEGNYVACELDPKMFDVILYSKGGGLGPWVLDNHDLFGHAVYTDISRFHLSTEMTVFAMSRLSPLDIYLGEGIHRIGYDRVIENIDVSDDLDTKKAIVLYSGGLDATLSTLKYRQLYPKGESEIIGLYFNWGSAAAKQEMLMGYKAVEKNLLDNFFIIDIEDMMEKVIEIGGEGSRLKDKKSKGEGVEEAESLLSYVPYRNTIFLTLAAAWAEKNIKDAHHVDMIIGANLSEGMVYGDNSSAFVESMEKTLSLGGKGRIHFNMYTPFQDKTKTEAIFEVLKTATDAEGEFIPEPDLAQFLKDVSFSCYFPDKDGNPCGKCGSCYLREKAFHRALDKIEDR